ncbi:hypothetical protein [Paenibacillus sp. 1A_MP2]|uniref:hypothetical protein n=1 Tax=Paenibacillus sp. 1A_MP2 TaxID=3457495 RepID=UPI003FCD5A94
MVSLDDLANEITSAVKAYTEDVTRGIEKELDKTSKQLTKEISVNSPKSKGKNSGRYATGWTRKKMNEDGAVKYIIHNKNAVASLTCWNSGTQNEVVVAFLGNRIFCLLMITQNQNS